MNAMKNGVQLSPANGMDLINQCRRVLTEVKPLKTATISRFRFTKLKYEEVTVCDYPHWYEYIAALLRYLDSLEKMLSRPDPIFISLLCYENLIKLSEGDRRANAVFILNY